MEKFNLTEDIRVYYVNAESFPDGVLAAHQSLHALVPFSAERRYFGLSRMENGEIIYKAAADELTLGDLSEHNLESMMIPAGNYQCIMIEDFMNNVPAIGNAFDKLTQLSDIDPQGYCIEWYVTDRDVRCMVRVL
ncbi:MAG: transcriptional regulator [Pedobacter sp.]|nr:MAG: transcriptional regulator [Pedobacter sp.]